MQKRLLADAEAALRVHDVQNVQENNGFLSMPAELGRASDANFARLAGFSLLYPFPLGAGLHSLYVPGFVPFTRSFIAAFKNSDNSTPACSAAATIFS
jgi:hypothetical protein